MFLIINLADLKTSVSTQRPESRESSGNLGSEILGNRVEHAVVAKPELFTKAQADKIIAEPIIPKEMRTKEVTEAFKAVEKDIGQEVKKMEKEQRIDPALRNQSPTELLEAACNSTDLSFQSSEILQYSYLKAARLHYYAIRTGDPKAIAEITSYHETLGRLSKQGKLDHCRDAFAEEIVRNAKESPYSDQFNFNYKANQALEVLKDQKVCDPGLIGTNQQVREAILIDQLAKKYAKTHDQEINHEDVKFYEELTKKVAYEYTKNIAHTGDLTDMEKLSAYKQAFDKVRTSEEYNVRYNAEAANLFDALIKNNDNQGEMQCGSGSLLFNTMLRENFPIRENQQVVYVYTNGHRMSGILNSDGELLVAETTSLGGTFKANLNKIPEDLNIRVTNANLDDYYSLLPENQRQNMEEAILFEKFTVSATSNDGNPENPAYRTPFGFGGDNTPLMPAELAQTDSLSFENYRSTPLGEATHPAPNFRQRYGQANGGRGADLEAQTYPEGL